MNTNRDGEGLLDTRHNNVNLTMDTNKEPSASNINPDADKKKKIIMYFLIGLGFILLILAIVLPLSLSGGSEAFTINDSAVFKIISQEQMVSQLAPL